MFAPKLITKYLIYFHLVNIKHWRCCIINQQMYYQHIWYNQLLFLLAFNSFSLDELKTLVNATNIYSTATLVSFY